MSSSHLNSLNFNSEGNIYALQLDDTDGKMDNVKVKLHPQSDHVSNTHTWKFDIGGFVVEP